MECEEFLADYSDFLDSRFEEHSLASYCEHLLSCSNCGEYDRVVRRGLELVRQLEPPESCPDLLPLVREQVLGPNPSLLGRAERGRAALLAGLAAAALLVGGWLAVLAGGRGTIELPPMVVEPAAASERPSLWGPAPKFTPAVELLQVPELGPESLLATPPEQLRLFRAPLGARRERPAEGQRLATQ